MTPSEELMLLFELNGYDVTKFRLKKYLEFDQATNNVNLYQQKTLKDLLIAHYTYTSDISELHKNPLTYQRSWALEIDSLDEFYVSHIDIEEEMTLKEFIQLDSLNTLTKESILYDVFDQWIEEYRNASIQQMENLERLIELLPKKIKKQRKPSLIAFLITTIIALLMAFLYRSKETLTPAMLPFLTPFVDKLHTLLYDWPLYSLFGVTVITLLVGHSVLNLFFKKFIKDVRGEKSKHAKRMFKKWNQDMEKARIKQSGVFEDYVERVMKNPDVSKLPMTALEGPEKFLNKFKNYVRLINNRYDKMTKYHKRFMLYLRLLFVLSLLATIGFVALGILTEGGTM